MFDGCAGDTGNFGVGNELDRICRPRVFRQRLSSSKSTLRVAGSTHGVFQHRAEADRGIDFGLFFGRQSDALGIAAPLDVEHAVVGPAMLVVADQLARDVGRERGLARARQAEEQRDVALRSFVGRAVHAEHALLGHQVVHQGEDALFHFAGILRAQDHELAAFEVEAHAGRRGHAGRASVGRRLAGVVDHVVGLAERGQFVGRGADQHVVHEQRMVGPRADHANLQSPLRIPAGKPVDDIQPLARAEKRDRLLAQCNERLSGSLKLTLPHHTSSLHWPGLRRSACPAGCGRFSRPSWPPAPRWK